MLYEYPALLDAVVLFDCKGMGFSQNLYVSSKSDWPLHGVAKGGGGGQDVHFSLRTF